MYSKIINDQMVGAATKEYLLWLNDWLCEGAAACFLVFVMADVVPGDRRTILSSPSSRFLPCQCNQAVAPGYISVTSSKNK